MGPIVRRAGQEHHIVQVDVVGVEECADAFFVEGPAVTRYDDEDEDD